MLPLEICFTKLSKVEEQFIPYCILLYTLLVCCITVASFFFFFFFFVRFQHVCHLFSLSEG